MPGEARTEPDRLLPSKRYSDAAGYINIVLPNIIVMSFFIDTSGLLPQISPPRALRDRFLPSL